MSHRQIDGQCEDWGLAGLNKKMIWRKPIISFHISLPQLPVAFAFGRHVMYLVRYGIIPVMIRDLKTSRRITMMPEGLPFSPWKQWRIQKFVWVHIAEMSRRSCVLCRSKIKLLVYSSPNMLNRFALADRHPALFNSHTENVQAYSRWDPVQYSFWSYSSWNYSKLSTLKLSANVRNF